MTENWQSNSPRQQRSGRSGGIDANLNTVGVNVPVAVMSVVHATLRYRAWQAALGMKNAELDSFLGPFLDRRAKPDAAAYARVYQFLRERLQNSVRDAPSPKGRERSKPSPHSLNQSRLRIDTLRRQQAAIAARIALIRQRASSTINHRKLSYLYARLAHVSQQIRERATLLNISIPTPLYQGRDVLTHRIPWAHKF